MIKLALAIAFLAVFGLAGYYMVVAIACMNKENKKNSNPEKNDK